MTVWAKWQKVQLSTAAPARASASRARVIEAALGGDSRLHNRSKASRLYRPSVDATAMTGPVASPQSVTAATIATGSGAEAR